METILIVEDDQMVRDLMVRWLTRVGFRTLVARDGMAAVAMAAAEHPDLVLMDLGLPGVNGCQATEALKAEQATRDIPVIIVTAFASAEDRRRAIESGCDDFETKPVNFSVLLGKIRALTERRASPAQGARAPSYTG